MHGEVEQGGDVLRVEQVVGVLAAEQGAAWIETRSHSREEQGGGVLDAEQGLTRGEAGRHGGMAEQSKGRPPATSKRSIEARRGGACRRRPRGGVGGAVGPAQSTEA